MVRAIEVESPVPNIGEHRRRSRQIVQRVRFGGRLGGMDANTVVETLRGYFEKCPDGIVCAWLFGSIARGTGRPDSDVDVAVLCEGESPRTLDASAVAMGGDIEAATGLPVDLVILNRAPVDLVQKKLAFIETCIAHDGSTRT